MIKLIGHFFFLCSFYAFLIPIYGLEKCDAIILDAGMKNPLILFYFLVEVYFLRMTSTQNRVYLDILTRY